ncbi:hypothetical protein FBU59_000697 [Linderina macrospora]|uniref:Uncharacterized protein n=1 Tax=Linderina macrospora TaxID=4868 RepID=A0ACC1JGC2_9FUNG|nr:hypothetical protein FBU59_000697 [Linderina macrospora]
MTTLPYELIDAIVKLLATQPLEDELEGDLDARTQGVPADLLTLRKVSRMWRHGALPYLFKAVAIHLHDHPDRIQNAARLPTLLEAHSCGYGKYIRHVVIHVEVSSIHGYEFGQDLVTKFCESGGVQLAVDTLMVNFITKAGPLNLYYFGNTSELISMKRALSKYLPYVKTLGIENGHDCEMAEAMRQEVLGNTSLVPPSHIPFQSDIVDHIVKSWVKSRRLFTGLTRIHISQPARVTANFELLRRNADTVQEVSISAINSVFIDGFLYLSSDQRELYPELVSLTVNMVEQPLARINLLPLMRNPFPALKTFVSRGCSISGIENLLLHVGPQLVNLELTMDRYIFSAMEDLTMINPGIFPQLISVKLDWDDFLGYLPTHDTTRLVTRMFTWSPVLRHAMHRLPEVHLPHHTLVNRQSVSLVSLDIEFTKVSFSMIPQLLQWFPRLETATFTLDCSEFATNSGRLDPDYMELLADAPKAAENRLRFIAVHLRSLSESLVPILKLMFSKISPSFKCLKTLSVQR